MSEAKSQYEIDCERAGVALDPHAPIDNKGRPVVSTMTDRELLEETVRRLRSTEDTIAAVMEAAKDNPMLSMFMGNAS
jgi:hypothetical protein